MDLCSPRIYCGRINFLTAVIFLSIHLGLTSSLHFKEMRIGTALNILGLICTVNALMEFPPVSIGIYILLCFFATDFQHNAFHSELHLLFFIGFPKVPRDTAYNENSAKKKLKFHPDIFLFTG